MQCPLVLFLRTQHRVLKLWCRAHDVEGPKDWQHSCNVSSKCCPPPGYSEDFWQAYHQLIPKAGGYSKRIPLYSLNHYLNGYLRAGPEYRGGALELMRKILDSLHVYYD